jgi:hypothetical protein
MQNEKRLAVNSCDEPFMFEIGVTGFDPSQPSSFARRDRGFFGRAEVAQLLHALDEKLG